MNITHAMVLAAGRGERMRPLTNDRPKPLVKVNGRPLIDYSLDRLADAGVEQVVVNHHYLGNQVVDHVTNRPSPYDVILSDETGLLLDTGGGVTKAREHLGDGPFFVINSDAIWLDDGPPALLRLADAWTDDMDFLLLTVPIIRTTGFDGTGDFTLANDGHLIPKDDAPSAPLAYCGVQLMHPRVLVDDPDGPFSMWVFWRRAIAACRFFGMEHTGPWLHVGTPQGRDDAEAFLRHR